MNWIVSGRAAGPAEEVGVVDHPDLRVPPDATDGLGAREVVLRQLHGRDLTRADGGCLLEGGEVMQCGHDQSLGRSPGRHG